MDVPSIKETLSIFLDFQLAQIKQHEQYKNYREFFYRMISNLSKKIRHAIHSSTIIYNYLHHSK